MLTVAELMDRWAQQGCVRWIGIRPERQMPMTEVRNVVVDERQGLVGDRYAGLSGKRQVTLLQYEHLKVIASMVSQDDVSPASLRRNLVVQGINLLALKGRRFSVGAAVLEYTGLCHPCSRMEQILGCGGYNAVRGHGGITARVIRGGVIRLRAAVQPLAEP